MNKPIKRQGLRNIAAGILTCAIVWYFVRNYEELAILQNIKIFDMICLIAVRMAIHIVYSLKLLSILHKMGLKAISYGRWLYIFLISRFINLHVTQGAMIYRSIQLKGQFDFPYTKSISLNTFFTWLETLFTFIFSLIILIALEESFYVNSFNLIILLILGIAFCLFLPIIAQKILALNIIRQSKLQWACGKLSVLAEDISNGLKDRGLILKFTCLNIVHFALQLVWMHICLEALNIDFTLAQLVLLIIIFQLSGSINFLPGNIGIVEGASGYLTKLIGWGVGAGLIIALLQRAIVYISFIVWGIAFIAPYKFMRLKHQ